MNTSMDLVGKAARELERDRYVTIIRTAPVHMQATMLAIIRAWQRLGSPSLDTGDPYDAYRTVCKMPGLQLLSPRAFGDIISELGLYTFIRVRVLSRGRYGRTRDIVLELQDEVQSRIREVIQLNLGLQREH